VDCAARRLSTFPRDIAATEILVGQPFDAIVVGRWPGLDRKYAPSLAPLEKLS
jgi:hypothetical protein